MEKLCHRSDCKTGFTATNTLCDWNRSRWCKFLRYVCIRNNSAQINSFAFIASCISSCHIVPLPLEVTQRIACFFGLSRIKQCYRAKIVFPLAEIMLPFDDIYTRASPRTLHNILYPAAVSLDAGYYNRAWVREYNQITQVRRRNSDASAILGTAWNDSRKLQQLRCGSEICAFTHWLQVGIILNKPDKFVIYNGMHKLDLQLDRLKIYFFITNKLFKGCVGVKRCRLRNCRPRN